MLSPWFCQLRKLVFYQSFPLYHVSESREGSPERHCGQTNGQSRTEMLVSNILCCGLFVHLGVFYWSGTAFAKQRLFGGHSHGS